MRDLRTVLISICEIDRDLPDVPALSEGPSDLSEFYNRKFGRLFQELREIHRIGGLQALEDLKPLDGSQSLEIGDRMDHLIQSMIEVRDFE